MQWWMECLVETLKLKDLVCMILSVDPVEYMGIILLLWLYHFHALGLACRLAILFKIKTELNSLFSEFLHTGVQSLYWVELITFEILAAERLRLMGFDNRLIIDCFANVVNILIWLFSTNDRFRIEKYESNYLENPFPEMKGDNLLSKTHRNDKSNLKPKTVLQE